MTMKNLYRISSLLLLLFAVNNTYAQTITTIAGGGTSVADGVPATSAYLPRPYSAVQAYDGRIHTNYNLFYGTGSIDNSNYIWRFSGTGALGFAGDGGPATAAVTGPVSKCAVDKWGRLYISAGNRIRRVDTNGIITTIAGTGVGVISGDGGPATAAGIELVTGIAFDTAGNTYITQAYNIRKISASGIITNYAGTGITGFSGDGGPATAAQLHANHDIACDLSGNLYFIDSYNFRVRKVNSAGIISTFAGNGISGYSGDGGPATAAQIKNVTGITTSGRSVIISDTYFNVLRQIDEYGIITTIAGTGMKGYSGDGGPATAATFWGPQCVSRHGGGPLYVGEGGNNVIRKIDLPNNTVYFTQGSTVAVTVCGGELHTIDTLLRVFDADDQQPLTWSIAQQPAHGVLAAWHWTVSDMGVKTPVGTSYAPHTGYYGTDTFKVRITDGGTPDTITIAVTIEAFPTPAVLTGPDTLCIGESAPFTASATGVWSVASSTATVSSGGVVTGLSTGMAVISYGVTNVCGTAWAAKVVTIMGPPYCNTGVASVAPSGFALSPNPSTGSFTMQLPQGSTAHATITDVAGRTVSNLVISHNTPINTVLPPGIYILHVTTPTGSWRSKLVIQ